jgi:8-oxo-dGTP diphosphatase
MTSIRTRILPPESILEDRLTYVVIGARQGDNWIFVRHRDRDTWEMPAGHIERGESADQAAVRELYEESGAVRPDLEHLCDYEVTVDGNTEYGRLYDAVVHEREELLTHETVEVRLAAELPENLTYPAVQTILFMRCKQQLQP